MGEVGSIYMDETNELFCPSLQVEVVDTTAAGDTYIAAFLKKYLESKDILGAMQFATKASAVTISRKGAQESLPYLKEIV
ncbi:ribokinase [Spiroplasma clarkii]|nr:ribokinase [Spiroplasma clarkii]